MRRYLMSGVFFAGCASLAVELSASRLIGNYFGSSNLVWAVIIGLILIYLSIGNSIGGKWADRSPNQQTFFSILCWAGLAIGLIPIASRPILKIASAAFDNLQIGLMAGTFLAVLILFSIPTILLGTASPFAIRLALTEKTNSGKVAGKIYALSTLGSFIGTFLPVLLLIPWVGTYFTFVLLGLMLIIVGLVCLWKTVSIKSAFRLSWMALILVLVGFFGLEGPDKRAVNLVLEVESAYNYIQIQEINGYHILRLNEGQGIHSIYRPETDYYGGPWQQVLVTPFFGNPVVTPRKISRIAVLGLAAGTSANLSTKAFPNAAIDGFEIDPKIIQIGYQYFDMDTSKLNAYAQDARVGLKNSKYMYDIISVDAFRPPYIPWHLTTVEFFNEVEAHLTPSGGLVINIARIFDDRRLVDSLYQTLLTVFPSVYIIDIPDTLNTMIFATKAKTNSENLITNYLALQQKDPGNRMLLAPLEVAITNLQPNPTDGIVLTDDHAPVEWIMNQMILDLVTSEAIDLIQ